MPEQSSPSPIWPALKEVLRHHREDVLPIRDENGQLQAVVYPVSGSKSKVDSPEFTEELNQSVSPPANWLDAEQALKELAKKL